MSRQSIEDQIIQNYQRDEQMMILVFAQWCVNRGLDPEELYARAYPAQEANAELRQAVALTVPREEAGEIPDSTVLGVLSLYGNEELAFAVNEAIAAGRKG